MKPAAVLLALALAACLPSKGASSGKCPRDHSLEIGLQEDVARFAGCEKAAGVTIRTGATIDVTPLHELAEITGDLSVGPTVGVDELAFNGLLRVGGTIRIVNNGSLRGLFFPRLEKVGRIEIENNAVLASISMPRVKAVQGAVVVTDNNALEMLSASLLETIGTELVISGHPKLNLVELGHLTSLQAIRLEDNPKLPADVVEQLVARSATPPTKKL